MRLYNIYYLCKRYEKEISGLNILQLKNNVYSITQWNDYKKALSAIRQIEFLKACADDFYETVPVFVREKDKPEIDVNIKNRLESKKNNIVEKMQTVIAMYESMGLTDGENGIDVKIPKCEDLKEYIGYLKELDFIFSQCPFLKRDDGEIRFNTVDVGSQWLNFLVVATAGTMAASHILNNLAVLIDKAMQVKSHLNSIREQEEVIRSRKLQNDILESTLESFEMLRKHYVSRAVEEMEAENDVIKDGEDRGRAEKSIEKLSGLLEKGVEIYASINSSKDIQVLFPPLGDKAELPDDLTKFLEDKKKKV